MNLKVQKKLAAQVMKCSPKRVWLDPNNYEKIKEAITKIDIKNLIKQHLIAAKPIRGVSRARANKIKKQRSKGRRKGAGSKKGTRNARFSEKRMWINKIRLQRKYLFELRKLGKIADNDFRSLYLKAKGNFFRSKRHIKLYAEEHGLIKNENNSKINNKA